MGLLLSVLITCVGVLEVIACYTRFQVGYQYTEAKSNIRDIAKYYAVELRKHELHFEPGPPGTTAQEETLSELMRAKSSVRVQERPDHNLLQPSSSHTPDQGTPNPALKVPRNSICGYDSPSIDKLQSPDIDISEAIDAIQEHENDASFWSRKSPSPYPDKNGLEVVESNFWRSRSPSPFPQDTETGTDATPELRNYRSLSPLLQTPDSGAFSLGSDLIENQLQNTGLDDSYTPALRKHRSVSPLLQTPASGEKDWNKLPEQLDEPLSPSDLEVKMILESSGEELVSIPRQPSPYPDILFSTVDDTEDTQFDEDFLRSLDGVKPPKCDDRRRTFRKKRNSSSTSSRTSRDDKSLTSLDESECEKRNNVDHQGSKEFIPVVEEESDLSGRLIHEEILPEKCEHISKPSQDETVKVTKQEETLFEASVSKQDAENKKAVDDKGKTNLTFTEKVKDLEISVQLMVTVKGTSQGDKMEYTTNVTQDKVSTALAHPETKDESVTETTEKASEFGNVKTSVTYGNSTVVPATKPNVNLKEIVSDETKPNLKDLQISSQSLIHAERTVQDDVTTSEDDFLKLYESFTELPEREKDKFLMRIGHKTNVTDNKSEPAIEDLDLPQTEVQSSEIKPHATIIVKPIEDTIEHIEPAIVNFENKQKNIEINETITKVENPIQKSSKTESKINKNEPQVEKTLETNQEGSDLNQKNEITAAEANEKTTNITSQEDTIKNKTTVINEIETCDNKKSTEQIPSETKPDRIEQLKKESDAAQTSSDSSSETPPTIVENRLRRASKTSFEEASSVQSQEMLKRRVSNSEISPKQANQAFWLIFSAEYTNAMEKDWHSQHFSCWQCDESLTGQRYVLRDEHPYCVKCYEQVFANPCEKCTKTIGIDSKDLSYKEKHWHEACFQCTSCKESLVDKQFGAKGEKIYCGNCYDKQFASRCDGCTKIFHAGTKKMEYKNRQWHEQCFKCCKCENPIGTKSFIPREKDIYCAGCYEEKFATRCVKCNKAIQSGGVTYKNEPWHRECFTCTHCSKNLAGQRFTSRDDKPCCADCFGKLFAKRCTSCTEPITGIGGTRFISFEDRHWHNDCFICANCSTSLVGRGFITDEDKIICPECAKERFM